MSVVVASVMVVHRQWCRPIVRQTQNSRRTKWLLRWLRRRRGRGEPLGDEVENGTGNGAPRWGGGGGREIGGEEDGGSERITAVSEGGYCLHRANQNQPFQHTLPFSPVAHRHTRVAEAYAHAAHARARAIPLQRKASERASERRARHRVLHLLIARIGIAAEFSALRRELTGSSFRYFRIIEVIILPSIVFEFLSLCVENFVSAETL